MGTSSVTGDETIIFADNASFDGTQRGGKLTADGQLWIGSTAAPHVRKGSLASAGGTVVITTGSGTINLEASASTPTSFQTDSGIATPAASILNELGSGSITTTGSGNTVTTQLTGLTNHAVLVGAGTTTITKLSVGSNGQVLLGATGADPAFGTLTSSDSSITFTTGANALGLTVTSGTTVVKTLTGDSGGALSPTAGNINILGGPGVTVLGVGSTLTVSSVPFSDTTATTLVVDNGYFATAAGTYVLPAAPAQGEMVIITADTAGAVVVDAPGTQLIRIGASVSSAGGTATSVAIGDSLTLRYRASNTTWHAVSVVGTWILA